MVIFIRRDWSFCTQSNGTSSYQDDGTWQLLLPAGTARYGFNANSNFNTSVATSFAAREEETRLWELKSTCISLHVSCAKFGALVLATLCNC